MQLSYTQNMAIACAGLLADSMFNDKVSMKAEEVIGFGLGLIKSVGEDGVVRLPMRNVCTILDDAGTYTAADISVTINGTTVTHIWATNKDTDMAALAVLIAALDFIVSATYTGGSTHTIVIVAEENIDLVVSVDLTAMTGTMTITSILYTVTDTFLGISVKTGDIEQGNRLHSINDKSVITFANDALAASDTVTVTVNGVALTAVTYLTSEAVTLQLVADMMKDVNGVVSATVSGRTITVLNRPGLPLIVNNVAIFDNALGAVAPSASMVASQQAVTFDIGSVFYAPTELVTVLRKGRIYVQVEVAVTSDDSVYVRHVASGTKVRGGFGNVVDSSTCFLVSAARYVTSAAAGGFAIVEINLP